MEQGCCRSHPHEEMDDLCMLKAEIAQLKNECSMWRGAHNEEVRKKRAISNLYGKLCKAQRKTKVELEQMTLSRDAWRRRAQRRAFELRGWSQEAIDKYMQEEENPNTGGI